MFDIEVENTSPIEILEEINNLASLQNEASDLFMNGFEFQGKTLIEWLEDTSVHIPEEITPEIFRATCTKVANKLQKASYYYTISNSVYNALESGSNTKKADIIVALMSKMDSSKGRRPAAETIKEAANSFIKDTLNSKSVARVLRDFWKERKDVLLEIRKILDMMAISMHVEIKYHEQT